MAAATLWLSRAIALSRAPNVGKGSDLEGLWLARTAHAPSRIIPIASRRLSEAATPHNSRSLTEGTTSTDAWESFQDRSVKINTTTKVDQNRHGGGRAERARLVLFDFQQIPNQVVSTVRPIQPTSAPKADKSARGRTFWFLAGFGPVLGRFGERFLAG